MEKRLNALLAECQAIVYKIEVDTVTQAQIDIHAIGQTNTAIEKEIGWLSIEFIIEKEHILCDFIRFGTFRDREKLQEIERHEIEFIAYLQRQRLLLRDAQKVDLLRGAHLRVEKLQLQTGTQLIALEQESEHPINIHRWTLLKWSDPVPVWNTSNARHAGAENLPVNCAPGSIW
jgi:hypothetical protein